MFLLLLSLYKIQNRKQIRETKKLIDNHAFSFKNKWVSLVFFAEFLLHRHKSSINSM